MKFVPIPQSNSIQLTCNLKTFTHKHRLTEYFDDYNVMPIAKKKKKKKKKERKKKESLLKCKSKLYLQPNENMELENKQHRCYEWEI